MWSVKCGVWSVNEKCKVLSVEYHRLTQPWQGDLQITCSTIGLTCCACHAKWRWRSLKCCVCHKKNATHCLKTTQKYCAYHTKRLSTRYETRLNVTKCHAKQHYNLIWHLQKGQILQLPPIDTAMAEEIQRIETTHTQNLKTSVSCETSSNFHTW